MQALYSVAYTLKFMFKKRKEEPVEYPVMPLEGLWWVEDGKFDITVKDNWHFTLMIMHPDVVTPEALPKVEERFATNRGDSKGPPTAASGKVRRKVSACRRCM